MEKMMSLYARLSLGRVWFNTASLLTTGQSRASYVAKQEAPTGSLML